MLNLSIHLEDKISAIREAKDTSTMNLDKLYGNLKAYELKLEKRQEIYGIRKKNTSLPHLLPLSPRWKRDRKERLKNL